ncbi:MAG: transglutaminase domain-containing protein [Azonexus sp.]
MKRRHFLAAAAASLVGSEVLAAKKKPATTPPKARAGARRVSKPTPESPPKPAAPVVHSADAPVIEHPPQGSSASRLPPVKAQEPPDEWRTYEITTTVQLRRALGPTRLWLPLPLNQDMLFQRTLGHSWKGNPETASLRRLPDGDLEVFHCEWSSGAEPQMKLTTTVTTADRHFDVTRRTVAPEREDILRRNLQASRLIPNDEEAHRLGERIVGRIKDPVAQVKALYDWVIENTVYDPAMPGVGSGDIRRQLETRQYGGRSADINGLLVALCRGIGIPARCVYGLRIGPSRLFRSLGLVDDRATAAQHVRAEFYVPGYGWIPVDPSDVRRVIALEGISDRDSKLAALRKILFGVWEMNWVVFNVGSDVPLPGSRGPLPFFVHPQLEDADGSHDGRYGERLPFTISARRAD